MIHEVDQRSDDWYGLRLGRMTASHAQAIGANGKGLESYIHKVMTEYYSKAPQEGFTSDAMQRGIDLEDSAVFMYEVETGRKVEKVGFVSMNEYVGASPDGFVDDDGLIEVKCPLDPEMFRMLLGGEIKPEYIAQVQMQMYITGRKWTDFVCYSPNFDRELIIKRVLPDEKKIEKLEAGILSGTKMIQDIMKQMENL